MGSYKPWLVVIASMLVMAMSPCIGFPSELEILDETPSSPVSALVADVCVADEFGRYTALEICFQTGIKTVRDYMKKLQRHQDFNVCRRFEETRSCLEAVVSECPEAGSKLHKHWQPVLEQIACYCDTPQGECGKELECLETELRGELVNRCDAMYTFNLQQRTKSKCFWSQENLDCKVALVSSACGASPAYFAYHLYALLAEASPSTARCYIQWNNYYAGFRYHADCPTYFPQDMQTCVFDHLRGHTLPFNKDNVLIAEGRGRDIKDACRYHREYKLCMRPKHKACVDGSKLLDDHNPTLRIYNLKMDYICHKDVRQEYSNKIGCYQEILHNDTLRQCNHIWREVWPHLTSLTAHEFFCRSQSENTQKLLRELAQIRQCYMGVFSEHCGNASGNIMGRFIDLAFQDPHLLRFQYKPDCALHNTKTEGVYLPANPDHRQRPPTSSSHPPEYPHNFTLFKNHKYRSTKSTYDGSSQRNSHCLILVTFMIFLCKLLSMR